MTQRWAQPTRYTLRRNTAKIMKDLVYFFCIGVGRQKTTSENNEGKFLEPGLYTYPDMVSELEKRQATCSFKSSGRKYSLAGYRVT